jgi:cell division transport system ATP-binding protein
MIIFSGVSKFFGTQKTAINHFSLEIKDGDLLVITGPSGAGKTTLMKLLIKEYEPSEGEIELDGEKFSELKKSKIPELRRKIGVVFQDYKLIKDMNVWENIALPIYIQGKRDQEVEERVTDLLNLVGLTDKALLFPRQLSGGEAQRVSIARALACGPKIIFADEPTGNLDAEASLSITRLLKKINQLGTTLLFATHDNLVLQELAKEKIVKLEKKVEELEKNNRDKEEETKKIDEIDEEKTKENKEEEKKKQKKKKTKNKKNKKEEKKK